MSSLKWVMICNVLIKLLWITAMVVLIMYNYPWWAGACLWGALFSGMDYEKKEESND
jgi:hypothetical protein